jgi:alginate O-acetyltransferase complex protein AlgI
MNFATAAYAVFLVITVLIYWVVPRQVGRWWLIIASLLFYGSWNAAFVPGFVALILANYGYGLLASRPRRSKLAVCLAVLTNLTILGIFKYLDWILGSSASLLTLLMGHPVRLWTVGLILPLAISFVTFTLLAYVIDVARGAEPERRLGHFLLFVTFFPHLIAGPIMRGWEFLPQVAKPQPFRLEHVRYAAPLLVFGLLKKAGGDQLAPAVKLVFQSPETMSTTVLWLGLIAFAFQILLDFSGYTDLALGSAALLGYRLPNNFDWPYRATSIQDFWHRWHMTLSRWLRDYVYIPLGGSRHGRRRTYAALLGTMLVGGVWHGAGMTFIVWGAWHGAGLAFHRWYQSRRPQGQGLPPLIGWALTFVFVLLGWVFFRAASITDAIAYLYGMFVPRGGTDTASFGLFVIMFVGLLLLWTPTTRVLRSIAESSRAGWWLALGGMAAIGLAVVPQSTPDFIYFQF